MTYGEWHAEWLNNPNKGHDNMQEAFEAGQAEAQKNALIAEKIIDIVHKVYGNGHHLIIGTDGPVGIENDKGDVVVDFANLEKFQKWLGGKK